MGRLRLRDLSLGTRILARTCIVAATLSAGVVLLTPFSPDLPGGVIQVLRSDQPEINRLDFIVALVGLAVAFGTLAIAAVTRGWRWRRSTLLLLAVAGLLMIPSGFNLPDIYGLPVRIALGLAYSSGVGLAILSLVRPHGPRLAFGALAAAPVMLTLAAFLGSRSGPAPDLAEQSMANDILLGVTALESLSVVLGLWAALEYSRVIAGAAGAALKVSFAARLVVLLILAKLAMILVTSTGLLPELLRPAITPWEQLTGDSWLSVGLAVAYVVSIGAWLLARRRLPIRSEGSFRAAAIIGLPLALSFIVGILGLPLTNSIAQFPGVMLSPDALAPVAATVVSISSTLVRLGPLMAVLLAAVVGAFIVISRRRSQSGVAAFLLAFVAWTGIAAAAFALSGLADIPISDPDGGPLAFVHPVTLDLAVTILVAILLAAWWRGDQRSVTPAVMLIVLALTTLIAYGQIALAGILATIAFWFGLAFPLVARFALSAGALNKKSPDREARVLAAVGFASLSLAYTIPMLALGFIGEGRAGSTSYYQALTLVPFASVMVGATIDNDRRENGESHTR